MSHYKVLCKSLNNLKKNNWIPTCPKSLNIITWITQSISDNDTAHSTGAVEYADFIFAIDCRGYDTKPFGKW